MTYCGLCGGYARPGTTKDGVYGNHEVDSCVLRCSLCDATSLCGTVEWKAKELDPRDNWTWEGATP